MVCIFKFSFSFVVQFCIFVLYVFPLWDVYFCFGIYVSVLRYVVFFCFGFVVSCFCIDGTLRKEKQSLHCVFVYYL